MRGLLLENLRRELPPVRTRFEIDGPGGVHLGWTNRYRIGERKEEIAIGINLPDLERGGLRVGTIAFSLHAAFRFQQDACSEIHTETWSGNLPMIGLAIRVGFVEVSRASGVQEVRGRAYDALRFALRPDRLWTRCPWLKEAEPSLAG